MSGSKKVFTTLGSSNHVPEEREAFDYYATDPRAVEMLLKLEQFSPVIWEPACGEGHISKVLQAHGYEVISTDLIYRGFGDPEPLDFLKLRCSPAAHPQMREVALILLDKVHALSPVCFDDIWSEYHADV